MGTDQRQNRAPPEFTPTEDWINALEAQCTQAMVARVVRYARARSMVAGPVLSSYAEDIVQNAISDTAQGILSWDCNHRTLEQHLRDAIKRQTSHDRQRSRQFSHHSLDQLTEEGSSVRTEAHHALVARTVDPAAAEAAADEVAELRRLVSDDPEVLALIEARASGATTKRELMATANLSSTAYHNARRRLPKYLAQLSSGSRRSRHRVA